MNSKPFVSICLASYNGGEYISQQLNSIYASLAYANIADFEIIVSDDGSSADTIDILKNYDDRNFYLVDGPRKGINKNFESLVMKANGEIVFLCDQDDVWMLDRVARAINLGADKKLVLAEARLVNSDLVGEKLFGDVVKRNSSLLKNVYRNSFTGAFMAGPKEAFQRAHPFPNSRSVMYDWWVGLIGIIEGYDIVIDTVPSIYYRRHAGNQTQVRKAVKISRAALKSRLMLLLCLSGYFVRRLVIALKILSGAGRP